MNKRIYLLTAALAAVMTTNAQNMTTSPQIKTANGIVQGVTEASGIR